MDKTEVAYSIESRPDDPADWDAALKAAKELHSDVVSLIECIEEVEEDGGKSYDNTKTRYLLGQLHKKMEPKQ